MIKTVILSALAYARKHEVIPLSYVKKITIQTVSFFLMDIFLLLIQIREEEYEMHLHGTSNNNY